MKTRMAETEEKAEESNNHKVYSQVLPLVYSSSSASDSDNVVLTRS